MFTIASSSTHKSGRVERSTAIVESSVKELIVKFSPVENSQDCQR